MNVQAWIFSVVVCPEIFPPHKHIFYVISVFKNPLLMKQLPLFCSSVSKYELFFLDVWSGTMYTTSSVNEILKDTGVTSALVK